MVSETAPLPEALCGKLGEWRVRAKVVAQDVAANTSDIKVNVRRGQCAFIAEHEGEHSWEA